MLRKCFVLLFLLTCPLQGVEWYSEYWQKLLWTMWENDAFAVRTFMRFDTSNHYKSWRAVQINEQLAWKASDDLTLEIHYAYLHNRSIVSHSSWRWQNRIELEANRIFHPSCYFEIRTRNRFEIRWLENVRTTQYQFRQQTMLFVPIENAGRLKAYSFYNEVFYDISTSRFTQDRLYPIQLTYKLSDRVDFEAFFMIRFFLHEDAWKKSAVLGTQFAF